MILTIILGILWLRVIPFGLGIFPCSLLPKKYRSPGMIFVVGYLIMMALFECEYLPALFLGMSFKTLCLIFRLSIGFLSLAFYILGFKDFKSITFPKMHPFFIAFILLVILQCVARWFQGVTDGDDAFFLGTAVNSYFGNSMYVLDPYTGFETGLDVRHAISPGGVYLAYLSNCIKIHPAITAHIVYADILLVLHYIVYYGIGRVLFEKKEENAALFAGFICVFDVFGNISFYTSATFLLTRTWQGKSVIANLCIPFAFWLLLVLMKEEETNKMWKAKRLFYSIMAAATMLAALTNATTGALLLPPMFLIGAAFVSIGRKKISPIVTTCIAAVPIGMLVLLYKLIL